MRFYIHAKQRFLNNGIISRTQGNIFVLVHWATQLNEVCIPIFATHRTYIEVIPFRIQEDILKIKVYRALIFKYIQYLHIHLGNNSIHCIILSLGECKQERW